MNLASTLSTKSFKRELLYMCRFYLFSSQLINRAGSTGDIPIIEYLVSRGCNPDMVSILGRSTLSKACWNGRIDVVSKLLELGGIDIDR